MEGEKFYTIKQVADQLGVHRTTIYDWMNSGRLAYVEVGERRRITQSALNAFIKAGGSKETKEDAEGDYAPGLMLAA